MKKKPMTKSETSTTSSKSTARRLARGQSTVEFALLAPIFLAFIFGVIEIGRAWAAKQGLTRASSEGARILAAAHGPGLLYASTSDKQTAAIKAANDYLLHAGLPARGDTEIVPVKFLPGGDYVLGTADDTIQVNYADATRGDRVGLSIKYHFETPLPIILKMFDEHENSPLFQDAINMGVVSHFTHE